ncbi:MAG TPA: carboxypeptidase-like regulatory domain-containing protein [Vicinamibacterales bacterium]|nr:carboxypeptidase-like regulatory domain-containing protein [Vicinamibacterales bacterium]
MTSLFMKRTVAGAFVTLTCSSVFVDAQVPVREASQPPLPAASQLPVRDPEAPPQTTGTGVLRGRVTRLDNGQPLRRVLITVAGTAALIRDLPTAFTDNEGRFELTGLPAARYTLTAMKAGFVTLQYGQRRPNEPGRPIELANAARLEGVDLALPRGAAIAGRIFDQDGEPVVNAAVQVLRQRFVKGRRQLASGVGSSDLSDDRGEFRVYGLPPGTYYVSASVQDRPELTAVFVGPTLGSVSTFYPGTSSPEAAQPVTVALGQEIGGLSFAVARARRAAISGVVRTADGSPASDATLSLSQSMVFSSGMSSRGGSVSPDGSFSWPDLPPGEYNVSASVRSREEFAVARVVLDGADVRVELTPRKTDVARGRITFDGGAPPASLRPAQVRIRPVSLDPSELEVQRGTQTTRDDWTFEVGVTPGSRLLRTTTTAGWAIKSVRVGDRDVTDTPLLFNGSDIDGVEIRLTDRLTDVSGLVRDGRGRATTDATVVLFADDPGKWGPETRFVAVVRPDQGGRFSQRGLPPASYVAAALEYLEPGEETNPATLERLRQVGTRFTLADAEAKTLDVTLSSLP